jgi:hypothetical protein
MAILLKEDLTSDNSEGFIEKLEDIISFNVTSTYSGTWYSEMFTNTMGFVFVCAYFRLACPRC